MDSLTGALMKNDEFKQMYAQIEQSWLGVDRFVASLQKTTPVNLMPGPNDPSSALLPKQALYKSYFPQTFQSENNLQLLTNPTAGSWGALKLLGTSGENVKDLTMYTDMSELEIAENMMYWGHIAPNAPDSVG